jgi:1-acyl-sn-glycerol-3-phosphate acyltransferase
MVWVWKLRAILVSAPAIVLATVAMACISLFCSLWDRAGTAQHNVARAWARMLLVFGFVRCRVTGLEKLDPQGSYVIVSNHSSYMDIPAILSVVPLQFRFFAKKGLFSIPFLGWHLGRAGHLPVVREDPRASLKAMSEGARIMREKRISLLVFPEGGRTQSNMRPFKEGAAYIAIKAGAPAVPVGLARPRNILPMHSALIRSGTIEVRIGDPIDTSNMKLSDRARLNEMLQERVAELAGETVVVAATA